MPLVVSHVVYLEEPEFVWGLVGTDDHSLDVADIDITAGDGER